MKKVLVECQPTMSHDGYIANSGEFALAQILMYSSMDSGLLCGIADDCYNETPGRVPPELNMEPAPITPAPPTPSMPTVPIVVDGETVNRALADFFSRPVISSQSENISVNLESIDYDDNDEDIDTGEDA